MFHFNPKTEKRAEQVTEPTPKRAVKPKNTRYDNITNEAVRRADKLISDNWRSSKTNKKYGMFQIPEEESVTTPAAPQNK